MSQMESDDKFLYEDRPLYTAIRNDDIAMLRHLLLSGVDVNRKDQWGTTALMLASGAELFCSPVFVEMLVDAGADIGITSRDGLTALDYATHGASYSYSGVASNGRVITGGGEKSLLCAEILRAASTESS
jgi:ankyrin repeat protein